MRRVTMTAIAGLTVAVPLSMAHAQNPPKSPGAEAPGGGGQPGEEPKPGGKPGAHGGAPARAPGQVRPGAGEGSGEGQPGRPAEGEQPGRAPKSGEPKTGETPPEKPKAGEARPEPGQAGEARPEPGQAGEAKPGRPGEAGKPAAARPAPHIAAAQRQQVVTRFRTIDAAPVHVDFSVRVGVAVPRTVVLRPVPAEIIDVVPEFEGFRFFVVPGEIVIVDPDTFDVVEVLPL